MESDELLRLRYKPTDLMRWEAALRRLGPEMVRLRFEERARPGARDDQAIPGLVAEPPYPPADFVERWLRGQAANGMSLRAMAPAISIAIVLAILSFLAFGAFTGALQNPTRSAGTLPTINDVISARPTMSQLIPPPGGPTPSTTSTTSPAGLALPSVPQGHTSD